MLQKYLVILKYCFIFVKQRRSVRLAGFGHLPFTEKITGSNPVRTTNMALSSTMARTSPSQGEEGGSTPLRATKISGVPVVES